MYFISRLWLLVYLKLISENGFPLAGMDSLSFPGGFRFACGLAALRSGMV